MWFGTTAPVSLISPRLLVLFCVYGVRVTGKVFEASVFSYRPDPKNQSRSVTMGPPSVASWIAPSLPRRSDFSRGVRTVHEGFVRFVRKLPDIVLLPLLVMALMTPPA